VEPGPGAACSNWRCSPASISTTPIRPAPDFVHTVTECAKLAYLDREAWYGDPDFVDVPMATLLSPAYNDARRKLVGDRASIELRPGRPDGREPHFLVGGVELAPAVGIGEPTVGALTPRASASRRRARWARSPATPAMST
jgi:hypothetical protein